MRSLILLCISFSCAAQQLPMPPTNTPAIAFKASVVDTNPQPVPALPYIIIAVTNPPYANQCGYNYFASSNGGASWQLYGSTVDRYFAVSRTNYYSQSLIFKATAVSNSSVPLFP